jgi:hypothetical protein
MLSVKIPKNLSSVKINFYENVDTIPRPRKRPSAKVLKNRSLEKVNFNDREDPIPIPRKRPLIF